MVDKEKTNIIFSKYT